MAYLPSFAGLDQALSEEEKKKAALQRSEAEAGPVGIGGQSTAGVGGSPTYTRSNFSSGKKILEANKDQKLGVDLTSDAEKEADKAQQAVGQARTGLQSQVGNTLKQYEYGGVGDTTRATQGLDPDKLDRFKKILSTDVTNLYGEKDPAAFSAGVPNFQKGSELSSLSSQVGLQRALQDKMKGGQYYGRGMSALDSTIYQKDQDFQNKVAQARAKTAGARQAVSDFEDKERKDILDAGRKSVTGIKDALRSDLGNVAGQITTAAQDAGNRYGDTNWTDQRRREYQQGAGRAQIENYVTDLLAKDDIPKSAKDKIINEVLANKSGGFVGGGKSLAGTGVYDQGQAAQFNQIMDLLDQGKRVDAVNPLADETFDINYDAIKKDVGKKADAALNISRASASNKQALAQAKEEDKKQKFAKEQAEMPSKTSKAREDKKKKEWEDAMAAQKKRSGGGRK